MAINKKRSARIYWFALALYTLLLSIAAAVGLRIVWKYATEYEAARPTKVIDEYVAHLSENLWDDSIAETIAAMPHEVQTDEECAECVKTMLESGISYQRQGSSDSGTVIIYNLLCNGNVFGKISLIEDESKAEEIEFGMLPWKLYKEEFDFKGLYTSVEIVVPKSYDVYLNNIKLGSEYIVEEGIRYDVLEDYYDEFADLPTKVKYKFDNVIGTLEPTVKDENGKDFVIDENKDDSQYIVQCSEEQLARLSEFAAGFADRFLKFSAGLSSYDRLMPYIKLGSAIDERSKLAAADGLGYSHTTSFQLDSVQLNGAVDLGSGYYLCDITAVTTITHPGKGEVQNTNNMRVICIDTNDDIRAVSQETY